MIRKLLDWVFADDEPVITVTARNKEEDEVADEL
jgi:hypothetical protein